MMRYVVGLLLVVMIGGCEPAVEPQQTVALTDNELRFSRHWQRLNEQFTSTGGRVIDLGSEGSVSTSEGQAYGLFFALVANQPERFAQLLQWTEDNLANGDLTQRLPAWLWGQHQDTMQWGIVDDNAASDADVWMAYALLEAGAAWQKPRYTALGKLLAARIIREETLIWNQQRLLLPGPKGFYDSTTGQVVLNPSYFSLALFEGLAQLTGDPRWQEIYQSSKQLLMAHRASGFVADWWRINSDGSIDEQYHPLADFDAIRTYLWLAFEAQRKQAMLHQQFRAMYDYTAEHGVPPEQVAWYSGTVMTEAGAGPLGFSIVIAPYLALFDPSLAELQFDRLRAAPLSRYQTRYYDTMLMLFGLGFQQQCFQFTEQGRLVLSWQHEQCTP